MIKPMATESTTISMEPCMKASGETTSNTARERKAGLMDPYMKASIWLERSMVSDSIVGMMVPSTRVNGTRIKLKALVLTAG